MDNDLPRFVIQKSATWTVQDRVWIVLDESTAPSMDVLCIGTVTECAEYVEAREGGFLPTDWA